LEGARRTAATLTWRTSAGKVVTSPPAEVRRDHAGALAELKAAAGRPAGLTPPPERRRVGKCTLMPAGRYGPPVAPQGGSDVAQQPNGIPRHGTR